MKDKLFCGVLLCALAGMLACGCTSERPEESSVAVSSHGTDKSSAVSAASSTAASSEDIILPPVGSFYVTDAVEFVLPDGWTALSADGDETLQAASQDKSAAVQILRTELPTDVGIREQLLAEEAESSLRQAWQEAGLEQVESSIAIVSLAGVEHPAVLLQALSDGKPVCQRQVYVLDGKELVTVTLSARSVEALDELLEFFHTV